VFWAINNSNAVEVKEEIYKCVWDKLKTLHLKLTEITQEAVQTFFKAYPKIVYSDCIRKLVDNCQMDLEAGECREK
jgi:hypothetical protein